MPEIADLETLRDRLGNPASILCLGNGPSSESPDIPEDCDCLFRVNWIWHERGFLTDPNLVFTGDPDAPPPGSRAIVGFPTLAEAQRILQNYRAPVDWFAVPTLLADLETDRGGLTPTNGALMMAIAVALAPPRLVISGIDLYLHPQGKYPGAGDDPNAYDAIHSRETDISFMRDTVRRYRGALTILSDALRPVLSPEAPKEM
jgi:hypothetical protein